MSEPSLYNTRLTAEVANQARFCHYITAETQAAFGLCGG